MCVCVFVHVHVHVHVRVRVRAYMHACKCVRACVYACVRLLCVCMFTLYADRMISDPYCRLRRHLTPF